MKLNNEVMLIGVACLIVGGAAGYLVASQAGNDYSIKGISTAFAEGKDIGCYMGAATETEFDACVDAASSESDYLTKKSMLNIDLEGGSGGSGGGGGSGPRWCSYTYWSNYYQNCMGTGKTCYVPCSECVSDGC